MSDVTDTACSSQARAASPHASRSPAGSPALRAAVRIAAGGAARADRERRLCPRTADAVVEAGFARHFVPGRWGGHEGTYGELLTVTAAVAEGCASAAWCAALWAAHGRFAAYLPPEGQDDLWGATPDVRIAAALSPSAATAERHGSGWRLRGEWARVSGVDFASWALLAAADPAGDGAPVRLFAVPRRDFTVRDTWHSPGLRGTGSNTVLLDPVFVPGHRTFPLADLLRGRPGPGRARCHAVPAHLGGGVLLCAVALGAAGRALEEWSRQAVAPGAGEGRPPHGTAPAERAPACASAGIDAGALLLAEAARRTDDGPAGAADVARNRRDASAAAALLVAAVDRLARTGAASDPLGRCLRDVRTVATHGALRPEAAAFPAAGRAPEAVPRAALTGS